MNLRTIAALSAACIAFSQSATPEALAADLLVPQQYGSIQSAINAAVDGDRVLVSPGTYNETLSISNKSITIRGTGTPTNTKIDRQGNSNVVSISGSNAQTVTFENLTMTRWYEYSRLLTSDGPSVVFNDMRLTNGGAGVYLTGGADFTSNGSHWVLVGTQNWGDYDSPISATSNGCSVTISGGSFQGCRGYYGGVLRIVGDSTASINGSFMSGCYGNQYGGALFTTTSAPIVITDCSFVSCQTDSYGGVAYHGGSGAITFERCEFVNCRSNSYRGGIVFSDSSGAIRLLNCEASGFYSAYEGAIVSKDSGLLEIRDSTFRNAQTNSGTTDDSAGGFIRLGSASLLIDSCVFENLYDPSCYRWGGIIGTRQSGGPITITGSRFTNCTSQNSCAGYWGRVIYSRSRNLTVSDCTFENPSNSYGSSAYGGAIAIQGGTFAISDSDFQRQYASSRGGAIYASNATGTISDCTFYRCYQDSAIGFETGSTTTTPWEISGCSFVGRGIRNYGSTPMTIRESTFVRDPDFGDATIDSYDNVPPFIDRCFFRNDGGSHSIRLGSSNYALLNACTFCRGPFQEIASYFVEKEPSQFEADCSSDCNGDGIPDDFEITAGISTDCNLNGLPDSCDFAAGDAPDCDKNGVYDICDIAGGAADCNANGVLDSCETDCDSDGIPNACEITSGAIDCNADGIPDSCQPDCDDDGVIDACELAAGAVDCNANGVPDACEIADGVASDLNRDGTIDACQPGMQFAGLELEVFPIVNRGTDDLFPQTSICYRLYAKTTLPGSAVLGFFGNPANPLLISATGGFWQSPSGGDLASQVPCNLSGALPSARYDSWFTVGLPCAGGNLVQNTGLDLTGFNKTGDVSDDDGIVFVVPGAAQSVAGASRRVLLAQLTTRQAVLPTGTISVVGTAANGFDDWIAYDLEIPLPPLVDCNGNGEHDAFDIALGASYDCDQSGVPDTCEYGSASTDCNLNGIPDLCDVISAFSADLNGNFVPDECECSGDVDGNGRVDVDDLLDVLTSWGTTGNHPADLNNDDLVDSADLVIVLAGYGSCG